MLNKEEAIEIIEKGKIICTRAIDNIYTIKLVEYLDEDFMLTEKNHSLIKIEQVGFDKLYTIYCNDWEG